MLDPRACYQALKARDERYDGRVFIGVVSTGIYCRPVCPAKAAKASNCRFFGSAAAAQHAGFRPCLRCRPEVVAELGAWRAHSQLVTRAMALITEGALDHAGAGVEVLAGRLGVTDRHLRRVFQEHVGASPLIVAQTRRVLFAKQLIHETRMPMVDVAFASGFGSVRQFNDVFRRLFSRPPSALRSNRHSGLSLGTSSSGVGVRLHYRPPYDWQAVLMHLKARAVDGVEHVSGNAFVRTLTLGNEVGLVHVTHLAEHDSLQATVILPSVAELSVAVTRLRAMFDVNADTQTIGAHLGADPVLKTLLQTRPGLRVPGAWDGFEAAARAIVGQQVTLEQGRRLAGALVHLCGSRFTSNGTVPGAERLTHTFPSPHQVMTANLVGLAMPRPRRDALKALARAALREPSLFHMGPTVEATVRRLQTVTGIGEWTAHHVAMHGVREPDAFPAADVALQRAVARLTGTPQSAALLEVRAEQWRPWRAYAAHHLWSADALERGGHGGAAPVA